LQKEVADKDAAESALRLALQSSNAMEWSWDFSKDRFICKGDLSRSLGLQSRYFSASMNEFLQLLHGEDRLMFQVQAQELALQGGELDTELRVRWSDGKLRDLVFRGRTQLGSDGRISSITGIAWDTTAQKTQGRIRQERDIHEAANKAKSMFLANASHEIRTPLAAINGYVEALLQKQEDPQACEAQTRSDLLAIDRNSKHLISLVNDFLDLSKLDTGRLYIQKSPMSLENELAESILMVKSSLDAKNLELIVIHETPLPPHIESDALRFRQILVNLLTNAIKFTDVGRITIRISHFVSTSGEGNLKLQISDSGIGMDEATKSHLFEPFMRGSNEEVQRVSGSGLGLALSLHLARLLGGDLKLLSSSRGAGSTFELTIHTGVVANLALPTNKKPRITSRDQLIGANILVVDDDADLRDLMKRFLIRQGANVDVGENGAIAVELATRRRYDVILMDMKMPILNGYDATAALRSRNYKGPIIALTAYANTDDKNRSLEAGCDNYLSKPVDFAFMVSTIRSHLERGDRRMSIVH
jgi:signal transduction histidine kinase/CheY-like chemotaxis protein